MFSLEQLQFAQRYPVTKQAKQILKEFDINLNEIPQDLFERASDILVATLNNKPYMPQIKNSTELLKNEILAFTLSKIILSCINKQDYFKDFANGISESCFQHLLSEKNNTLNDIALELNINFFPGNGAYFAEVKMLDYLSVDFNENFMKLVNQKLEKGKIYLTKNDFARFVSKVVYNTILDSLPLPTKEIPERIKKFSKEIPPKIRLKKFSAKGFAPIGKVKPEAFPSCMARIYNDLMQGKKVPHIERFTIATFCLDSGMGAEQVVQLYKATPNWNEQVTRYQVMRLAGKTGKKINSPSCEKLREYGIACENCNVKHPCIKYRQNLKELKKEEK